MQLGAILSKQDINGVMLFKVIKVILGNINDTLFNTNEGTYTILNPNDLNLEYYVSFIKNIEDLKIIYNSDNIEDIIDNYYNFIKKYTMLYNGQFSYVYNDVDIELIKSDNIDNHINNKIIGTYDYKNLYNILTSIVYGQDENILKFISTLSYHMCISKSNVIIDGEKGCGKTFLLDNLKKYSGKNVLICDMENNDLNYVYDSIIYNGSKNSILALDNVDKKLFSDNNMYTNSIINLLKGNDIYYNNGMINTSNMFVILSGNFKNKFKIGFNNYYELPLDIKNLCTYICFNPVNKEMIYNKILYLLSHYVKLFKDIDIKLLIEDGFIENLISKIIKSNNGLYDLDKLLYDYFISMQGNTIMDDDINEFGLLKKTLKNNKYYIG